MTEDQKNPNEKLLEDLEFTKKLVKEQKQKEKQLSEDTRTWLPEKFSNTGNEKNKKTFTGKRYKTPWEAGGGRKNNEYEKKKSSNYKFRSNQDEEFKKPYETTEKTNAYNKPYKSRESKDGPYRDNKSFGDRNYKQFNKPWERNENKSTNWKSDKFNKYKNYQESSYVDKNDKAPQKSWRETGNTKQVNWKWDNRNNSMKSRKHDGYPNRRSDDDEDDNKSEKPWKKNTSRYTNTNWKWNKHHDSAESGRFGANETDKYRRGYKKHWDSKETKPTGWKWAKRDQSPSEDRNQRYKESREWNSNKYEESNNKFKTRDSKQYRDFDGFKNQGPKEKFQKSPYNPRYSKNMDKENNDPAKSSTRDIKPMSMVKRREWGAQKTKWGIGPPILFPIKYIFCLPTSKRRCFNLKQCSKELLYLQERHTCTPTCPDIKYSFFIGTNGTVYECRGWRTRPGLPKKFEKINKASLFIALAGQYSEHNTPPAMISARDYVIRYGVRNDLIDENYVLHSAVDHPTMSKSDVDYSQGTDDQGSQDEGSRDRDTQDQDSQDQDTQDQDTQDQDTQDQETDDRNAHGLGSHWEDGFNDTSTVSGSSVKSWESYSSSWDLSEGDLRKEGLIEGDVSDGDV